MRRNGNEVSLLPIIIGHFEEPDTDMLSILGRVIDNFGLDYCCHFSIGAEPLPSRLARANDVGPLRIAQVGVRIGLLYRIKSNETGIVPSRDSNLLADRATYGLQRDRIRRAAFRLFLQMVLLRQTEF